MKINTEGLTPHPVSCAASLPMVQGSCPACGNVLSLFLAVGGYVTCSNLKCPDPGSVTRLLVPGAPKSAVNSEQ